jgi:hypothetical protein
MHSFTTINTSTFRITFDDLKPCLLSSYIITAPSKMLKMENDCGDYVLISKDEAAIGSRYDNSQSSLDLNGM